MAEDIAIGSAADGIPKVEEFFKIFAELAAENGDCPDLSYSPVLSGSGYRVDGYAFEIPEDVDGPSRFLGAHLVVRGQLDEAVDK
jgi:hypothetical protein